MKYFSLGLGVVGVALICYSVGWEPALGVFLMMWADNISKNLEEWK